eukprot:CAMPEP_0178423798 /NCGR_PEP_ID=MMETSP0689_2-20121128/27872_1 /TAXON_ID=160604 /ORGANISM="Amphidinium massartii, Strain CS-259" /LENGTH=684 /DNA_ID=CAMNT_0020045399 /DNA_START=47 /DNA_END=2101 /DNA_ORIENTATION=+
MAVGGKVITTVPSTIFGHGGMAPTSVTLDRANVRQIQGQQTPQIQEIEWSKLMMAGGLAAAGASLGKRRLGHARRSLRRMRREVALRARGGEEEHMSDVSMWSGLTPGKEYRLQTKTCSVADQTRTIRSLDWDRDRFDIEFALERGTTYNAYVIKGADKTALIDSSHEKFEGLFMPELEKEADLKTLDYLVVSHTEPDHSGLIAKVVTAAKEAGNEHLTVIGSKVCLQFLENLVFVDFNKQVVANGDKIDLGGGHELEFVIAPNLHWPDTIFTFDHGTGVLYTCDAFGMHYCSDNVADKEPMEELLPHYALYYDCLMKPNARSVLTALKKTSGFEIKQIATGHGPMLVENADKWVEKYSTWSTKATAKKGPSAAVFWVSNFGQSERLAQLFAYGLTSSQVNVEMMDLNAADAFEITEALHRADILAVCTPPADTLAAKNVASIVAGASVRNHRVVVLESCGDGQVPVELLANQFRDMSIEEALAPVKVPANGSVTPTVMQSFEESGLTLGKALTQKDKTAALKKTDKDLSKALGRISSSLYIITAAKAGVRHAMVASWVSPASEEPLGITLTIAKDRAMEPLLRVGDTFIVNVLEEGNPETRNLMKHFLQKFEPGTDRLVGVDSFPAECGAAVLRGAFAYFECKIMSRMDASDHWVSYAEVISGNVQKEGSIAAVHHRKVGTYY